MHTSHIHALYHYSTYSCTLLIFHTVNIWQILHTVHCAGCTIHIWDQKHYQHHSHLDGKHQHLAFHVIWRFMSFVISCHLTFHMISEILVIPCKTYQYYHPREPKRSYHLGPEAARTDRELQSTVWNAKQDQLWAISPPSLTPVSTCRHLPSLV